MDVEQFKEDVREGRIGGDRLADMLVSALRQLEEAKRRIQELEEQLKQSATVKLDEPYSVAAEEKRQAARGKKARKPKRSKGKRRGRITTAEKIAQAVRTEPVYPEGVAPEECWLSHARPVWRLEGGQVVLVAFPPRSQKPVRKNPRRPWPQRIRPGDHWAEIANRQKERDELKEQLANVLTDHDANAIILFVLDKFLRLGFGDREQIKAAIREIDRIVVHAELRGYGTGQRHLFKQGETYLFGGLLNVKRKQVKRRVAAILVTRNPHRTG
jgi:hypothetical protein